jgi:hypothetical protein
MCWGDQQLWEVCKPTASTPASHRCSCSSLHSSSRSSNAAWQPMQQQLPQHAGGRHSRRHQQGRGHQPTASAVVQTAAPQGSATTEGGHTAAVAMAGRRATAAQAAAAAAAGTAAGAAAVPGKCSKAGAADRCRGPSCAAAMQQQAGVCITGSNGSERKCRPAANQQQQGR